MFVNKFRISTETDVGFLKFSVLSVSVFAEFLNLLLFSYFQEIFDCFFVKKNRQIEVGLESKQTFTDFFRLSCSKLVGTPGTMSIKFNLISVFQLQIRKNEFRF